MKNGSKIWCKVNRLNQNQMKLWTKTKLKVKLRVN